MVINIRTKALCEAPILAYPLPKGLFVLDTDASNVGIGGVLSQVRDNKENVIALCCISKSYCESTSSHLAN
jgi:hypothetical protein